jgi:hypothetical protein
MSIREMAGRGASQESNNPSEMMNGYPYSNLSVQALARNLNERIYGNPDGPVESIPLAEAELPDLLEEPEAEAA